MQRVANDTLSRRLAAAVDGQAAAATFACGGSVPISSCVATSTDMEANTDTQHIQIRCADGKICFPMTTLEDSLELQQLVRACQPASFGLGGKDVIDETYRKAGKLDRCEFLTDFHPHDCGIIDSIRQILLPSMIEGGEGVGIGTKGVRAELYKLNIYSAPSGKFDAHIDTPRGADNFGSLVVCLPCSHSGGSLLVWHKSKVVNFDWSNEGDNKVRWAAFYGDCQHQVTEVTKGDRITLTYNLFYTSVGDLAQPVADPKQLALYGIIKEMYEQPGFLKKGALLGFFCNHQYAHLQTSGRLSLPGSLKGVDLAVFASFKTLGLRVLVKPVIEKDGWHGQSWGGLRVRHRKDNPEEPAQKSEEGVKIKPQRKPKFDGEFEGAKAEPGDSDYDSYGEYDDRNEEESYNKGTVVGTALHGPKFGGSGGYEDMEMDDEGSLGPSNWPHQVVDNIHWLNDPMHEDFAEAHLAYGNEPCLGYSFSAAAIIVTIPSSSKRELSSSDAQI
ncbi:hypothetical protein P7C71_g614, partial [Lecanoromycetidae sp. Uapishka_2]